MQRTTLTVGRCLRWPSMRQNSCASPRPAAAVVLFTAARWLTAGVVSSSARGSEDGAMAGHPPQTPFTGVTSSHVSADPITGAFTDGITVTYTPGSGASENVLAVPSTILTTHCDVLSEALAKTQELEQQKLAQEALGGGAVILSEDSLNEMMEELKEVTSTEVASLVDSARQPGIMQKAGMHELRRTLFYAVNLHERGWIDSSAYTVVMRALTVETLRRDGDGVLAPDDVLYISTYVIAANFYNRHLWNRMELAMQRPSLFDNLDIQTVKALTTKLFKTRRGCPTETLDMRRKILSAMQRRVGVFANELDLPSLLGILQCYSVHDMTPYSLEPLAVRASNHIHELTPHECATLAHVLRKFRLLRLEVCERLVERICASDQLTHHMASAALTSIRVCYNRVSDGGRGALHAEPTRQKLRAIGEQIGARLDEVAFPALRAILHTLDVIVNVKLYVPKRCLTALFGQTQEMLELALSQRDVLVDPKTGKHVRPITAEEGRHLQALLRHYGEGLCPGLQQELKTALREGLLPDEASLA